MSIRSMYPSFRSRRLRRTNALQTLVQETTIQLSDLVLPIFIEEDIKEYIPIPSMPGVFKIPENKLPYEVERISKSGIQSILVFGISHHMDGIGSDTWKQDGLLSRIVRTCKETVPELIVISDICFCAYTIHGHCGIMKPTSQQVDNDLTLNNLALQAVLAAQASVDFIAPSGAMDGQVQAIRTALDDAGFIDTAIMSYSTKFASAFYSPFREVNGTLLTGNRKTYQLNPLNRREAVHESLLDEQEGADILMVKPASVFLDIIRDIREVSYLPIAAFQVSGEYAMIKFSAMAGIINEPQIVRETIGSIKRAGADIIITYFAMDLIKQGL